MKNDLNQRLIDELSNHLIKNIKEGSTEIGTNMDVEINKIIGNIKPYEDILWKVKEDWGKNDLYYELEDEFAKQKLDIKKVISILKDWDVYEDYFSLLNLNENKPNPQDIIKVDVPLFIRLLEYAREDAKTDMDLHDVAENIIKLSAGGNVLGMEQYNQIVKKSLTEEKENSNYKKYIEYINKLADYVCNDLKIEKPEIIIINDEKYTQENKSFGGYVPGGNKIYLVIKNRNCADASRTLVHELKHAQQDSLGLLNPESGNDGSEHENEANSYSGEVMRKFGRENPEIFTLKND